MAEIRNRFTGNVIATDPNKTIRRLAEDNRANLDGASLYRASLYRANLDGANLYRANLYRANLYRANLDRANLYRANLDGANLDGANLYRANLDGAKISFHIFPSIRLLSSIPLGRLPDDLTLELMRRDAYAHPLPEKFDAWAKDGPCPYQNEERFWQFEERKDLWSAGDPQMADRDLIVAICKAKGWGIAGVKFEEEK